MLRSFLAAALVRRAWSRRRIDNTYSFGAVECDVFTSVDLRHENL
jgi:hypothetical protein